MNCNCKYVFEIKPTYIPSYKYSTSTSVNENNFIPVPQYECLRCGKIWGYLGQFTQLVEAPKIIKQYKSY